MKQLRSALQSTSRSIFTYVVLVIVVTMLVSWTIAGTLIHRRSTVNRLSRNSADYHSATRLAISKIESELSLIRQNRYQSLIQASDAQVTEQTLRDTIRSTYIIDRHLEKIETIQQRFGELEFEATTRRLGEAIRSLHQASEGQQASAAFQSRALKLIGIRCIQLDRLHANAFRDDALKMQRFAESGTFLGLIFSLIGLGFAAIVTLLVFAKRAVTRRDQLERQIARRVTQAELLYLAVTMSEDTKSYRDALQKCVGIICRMTEWAVGHVYFPSQTEPPDTEPSQLVSADIWYLTDPQQFEAFRRASEETFFVTGECLPGRIWNTGQPVWIEEIQQDPGFVRKSLCESHGMKSAFGFPLVIDGKIAAVLEFFSQRAMPTDDVMLLMARSVGEQVGRVLERIQAEELERRHHERIEAELNEAKKELVVKTRLAAIGQVSAQVAHEIRNPLGAISNAIYYLKRSPQIDQEKKTQYLDLMNHEIGTCNEFINELLDITRRRKLDRQPTRLGDLIERVLSRHQMPQNIDLRVHCNPDPFECFVDGDQFVQVLQNLLNNSMDALQGAGGRIGITAQRVDDQDVITVYDSGPGIPAEDRTSVFDVLFTTKSSGTGLGLAICKQIVVQHGGSIQVADNHADGTEFQIRLPALATSSNSTAIKGP
ncbi:Globin-coupled histidine kinase [Stieleria maiorica]|uniref:histidine kinase n=1 Tax=Stieleria maiorica TaxID=2795974 RepID=A0A5B9MAL1_9BACT|nr:ATP-binding protein [Stieleria maiorica]QEF98262.1 Globin-coupled histidine kinase [Stieleria maiorica]